MGIHWDNICESNHEIARCLMTTQEGPVAQFLLPCLDRLKPRTVNRAWRLVGNFSEVSQPADQKQHVTKAPWFRTPRLWVIYLDSSLEKKSHQRKADFSHSRCFSRKGGVLTDSASFRKGKKAAFESRVHFFNTVFVKMGGH